MKGHVSSKLTRMKHRVRFESQIRMSPIDIRAREHVRDILVLVINEAKLNYIAYLRADDDNNKSGFSETLPFRHRHTLGS